MMSLSWELKFLFELLKKRERERRGGVWKRLGKEGEEGEEEEGEEGEEAGEKEEDEEEEEKEAEAEEEEGEGEESVCEIPVSFR